jgi:transposase
MSCQEAKPMEILYPNCAGGDVHLKTVVVCAAWRENGRRRQETRTFGTTTGDLLQLADWLVGHGITHIALESTGVYWKPVYYVLESQLEVWLVNAQHVKKVPGRKTDVSDAEWLAAVMECGLVRASFVPPPVQRELRDLTRQRANLVRDRTQVLNRLQKILEDANVKLAAVVSDINGVSALEMLRQMVAGTTDAPTLAGLARGSLRKKRAELEAALSGRFRDHHRFLLGQALSHLDFLDEQLETFSAELMRRLAMAPAGMVTYPQAVALWDSAPGVNQRAAEVLVAEIGVDMSRFATPEQLASWCGVCPGNNQSAGQRRREAIAPGDRPVRKTLTQCAHAAARTKGTYLQALYHRVAARRGKKRALMAVAHSLVVSGWHMLSKNQPYREPQAAQLSGEQKTRLAKRMLKRLNKLGYEVTLNRQPPVVAVPIPT